MKKVKTENKGHFRDYFTKFIVYFLRVIVSLIAVVAIEQVALYIKYSYSYINTILMLICMALLAGTLYAIKKNIELKKLLIIMIAVGFVLRLAWSFSLENLPVSDFNEAYKAAIRASNGDYGAMMGTAYFGRFPHYVIFILYMSKCILLFGDNALIAMKFINVLLSTSTIIFLYLILKQVFECDYKRIALGTFISSIMPASILYTPVYCTENLAIPFYLASIYVFILVMNNKKSNRWLMLSALLLLMGHLFRMVAQIVLIAFVMYIIVYKKEAIRIKIKSISFMLCSFIIPFIVLANLLIGLGITDRKLWNGSEPNVSSILKGSNIDNYGRWNEEDASFIDKNIGDREYLEQACKEKIIERYTTTSPSKLIEFVIVKIVAQWKTADCSGAFWAQLNVPEEDINVDIYNKGNIAPQLIFISLLLLTLVGLFNKKEYMENKIINLFYIIFCGYGAAFLILESQDRYAFIINWIFIIFAMTAIKQDRKLI